MNIDIIESLLTLEGMENVVVCNDFQTSYSGVIVVTVKI